MSYELFIAKRYLRSKRKTGFISLITYISILGVMIGVAALIIVLSVMNGFETEVRSRIIGFGTHIELKTDKGAGINDWQELQQKINTAEHIVGISPYISEKALIISKKVKHGVVIKGVDPGSVDMVSDVRANINYGVFEIGEIEADGNNSYPGIVLGTYLADKLNADIGDKIRILSPAGIKPFQSTIPNLHTFTVTGYFETGIFEFDDLYAYISIKEAQRLFEMNDKVSGLEIKLDNLNNADSVADRLRQTLQYPYVAITWFEMHKNLYSSMQLEKWGMFIILSLIIIVAAFNIISTLIMIVIEKTKEIGILKSMGASAKGITKIFVLEGLIGGLIGTILGCFIGFSVCWLQIEYKIISMPSDIYTVHTLPVIMNELDFILITVVAILLCYFAAVYPARKAARLEPVEAMRY